MFNSNRATQAVPTPPSSLLSPSPSAASSPKRKRRSSEPDPRSSPYPNIKRVCGDTATYPAVSLSWPFRTTPASESSSDAASSDIVPEQHFDPDRLIQRPNSPAVLGNCSQFIPELINRLKESVKRKRQEDLICRHYRIQKYGAEIAVKYSPGNTPEHVKQGYAQAQEQSARHWEQTRWDSDCDEGPRVVEPGVSPHEPQGNTDAVWTEKRTKERTNPKESSREDNDGKDFTDEFPVEEIVRAGFHVDGGAESMSYRHVAPMATEKKRKASQDRNARPPTRVRRVDCGSAHCALLTADSKRVRRSRTRSMFLKTAQICDRRPMAATDKPDTDGIAVPSLKNCKRQHRKEARETEAVTLENERRVPALRRSNRIAEQRERRLSRC